MSGAEIMINLLVGGVFGGICAAVAHSRGRNAVGWFFVGFLTSCVGLIIVLVLPDLREQEARERRQQQQTRQMREELKMHRAIADQRHQETIGRLGVHDRALGIDTGPKVEGQIAAAPPPAAPASDQPVAPPPPPPVRQSHSSYRNMSWFYSDGTAQLGPITFDALSTLWRNGAVTPETLVWAKGMPEWMSVSDIPGFGEQLSV
jgi:hypothetical protein